MSIIKLLIIEDDDIDQRTIQRALKKSFLNVEPEFANSLTDADQLLKKEWDLILTDYNLPQTNGVEILKYLRENVIDTCARWMGSAAVARGPAGKGMRQVFDLTACTPLIPISD